MKPKPTELPPEQQPIRLSVNTLLGGRFIPAGDPLPVSSSDDLPEILRPFVVTGDDEPEAEEEARANYELNTVYQVNSDGRLGRVIARQVAQMEAQAEQQAWVEEQLSEPLPREVADALQAASDESVGQQMAEAQAAARRIEMADEAAAELKEKSYEFQT